MSEKQAARAKAREERIAARIRDGYVAGLKRELAGRCARQGGESADAVLAELARHGERVETRGAGAAKPKRTTKSEG